ncbi:MAG TPA: ribulose-phosphate 3-epimerase [bacterium]|nr:ribulose-phosphate 3-epimerase [bacterium]
MFKIAPSILSGDFGKLSDEAKRAEDAGADWLHLDVMDGHFVPNITFGPQAVAAIRKAVRIPLDVHLMIQRPDTYYKHFVEAGANILTVHVEPDYDVPATIDAVRKMGAQCGVVLNPDTPFDLSGEILKRIDLILFMTVYPGFGGQKFIESVVPKIRDAKKFLDSNGYRIPLEVDGGITAANVKLAVDAGISIAVAGSAVYGKPDIKKAIEDIRKAAQG